MFRRRRLACSFCGKSESDVGKLIAGPKVYICDQCVALASKIMEADSGNPPRPPEPSRSLFKRLVNRIVRVMSIGICLVVPSSIYGCQGNTLS